MTVGGGAESDILENCILSADPELLYILLVDRTTGRNNIWATNDYSQNVDGFYYNDEITSGKITGDNWTLIMPRVLKEKQLQQARVREKSEVFTPSWICNAQNNLVDNAWFGREKFSIKRLSRRGFIHGLLLKTESHSPKA